MAEEVEVLNANEIHYELILGKPGAKDKIWVSAESELAWLKELHNLVREHRKSHAGWGWIDHRLRAHIRDLEGK